MKATETPQYRGGGIYNYFQGATINNIVINGSMTKSGTETYSNDRQNAKSKFSLETVAQALDLCKAFIWGQSAYGIAFCVCRDVYHMENNASLFERQLADKGIQMPAGTINTAFCRNAWMKFNIDRWEEVGASKRALRLRDELLKQTERLLAESDNDTATV